MCDKCVEKNERNAMIWIKVIVTKGAAAHRVRSIQYQTPR